MSQKQKTLDEVRNKKERGLSILAGLVITFIGLAVSGYFIQGIVIINLEIVIVLVICLLLIIFGLKIIKG